MEENKWGSGTMGLSIPVVPFSLSSLGLGQKSRVHKATRYKGPWTDLIALGHLSQDLVFTSSLNYVCQALQPPGLQVEAKWGMGEGQESMPKKELAAGGMTGQGKS